MYFDVGFYNEFPTRRANGKEWKELGFALKMRITSGQIYWSTRYKGIEIGSVKFTMGKEGKEVI
jgi:hypothetical protein